MKTVLFYILIFVTISSQLFAQKVEVDNGYEKGVIKDGYKEGEWQYFDNDTLKLKIDYSTGKLTYLYKDNTEYAILTESGWEFSKLDVPPYFIGSNEEIIKTIYSELNYPVKALGAERRGTVLLKFEINLQGKVDNVEIVKDIGLGCGDALMEVFKKVPNFWLVAQKGNKRFKSRYILPVHFKIGKMKKGNMVFKKDSKKELKKLRKAKEKYSPVMYLPEISITAFGVVRSRHQINRSYNNDRIKRF